MKLQLKHILFIAVLICTATIQAQKQFEEFVLIGNSTGLKEIKASDVLRIFKGQQSNWNNGNSVTLVLPSTKSSTSEKIAKLIYNTSSSGMQKYWLGLVFQGRANPPFFIDSSEEIIRFVQRTPGAVAFIPVNQTDKLDDELIIRIK
jgi:ABC-type phosphate transport system substrate-binding protein